MVSARSRLYAMRVFKRKLVEQKKENVRNEYRKGANSMQK